MCSGVGGLKKDGGWELEVGRVRIGGVGIVGVEVRGDEVGGVGVGGLELEWGSWGRGVKVPDRDTNHPDPHRFLSCRPLLHFTRFASNRLCDKSSSRQVVFASSRFRVKPHASCLFASNRPRHIVMYP